MNYLKIEKKYRNNCLKASQAEGREFESRLPLNFQYDAVISVSASLDRLPVSCRWGLPPRSRE